MSHCLKFMHNAPNWTTPNQITLNWTMQSQTKDYIAKSCKVWALLGYYAT